jgi:mono/diheme cytochrome c family protein
MALRLPPSLHERAGLPPGYYYTVISEGFGLMPSYAEKLQPEERWAVVAYVLALQRSQRARLEDVPAEVRTRLLGEGSP